MLLRGFKSITMKDSLSIKAKNIKIIDVSEQNELKYWSDKFGIRPEVLKTAMRASRSNAVDHIIDYLKSANKISIDYRYQ